jgi:hypothetical protein
MGLVSLDFGDQNILFDYQVSEIFQIVRLDLMLNFKLPHGSVLYSRER